MMKWWNAFIIWLPSIVSYMEYFNIRVFLCFCGYCVEGETMNKTTNIMINFSFRVWTEKINKNSPNKEIHTTSLFLQTILSTVHYIWINWLMSYQSYVGNFIFDLMEYSNITEPKVIVWQYLENKDLHTQVSHLKRGIILVRRQSQKLKDACYIIDNLKIIMNYIC